MAIFLIPGALGTHLWCRWVCSHTRNLLQATGTVQVVTELWDSTNSFPVFSRVGSSDGLYLNSAFIHQFCFNRLYGRILQNKAKKEISGVIKRQPRAFSCASTVLAAQPLPEWAPLILSLLLFPVVRGSRGRIDAFGVRDDNICAFWTWYWQLGCFSCVVSTSFVKSTTIIPW